jgi:cytochrome c oxidase subunit II
MFAQVTLFPEQASSTAPQVDALFFFILGVTGFVAIAVAVVILYFAIRYRRVEGARPPRILGSTRLEVTWSVVPFLIFLIMFGWGARVYFAQTQPPEDAIEVYVVGKQWMWKIQHPEGVREINELHVPTGENIKLIMTSQDVIHSFFVPAFRLKQDVLPGRYTTLWFKATQPGRYHLFCAEYCGTNHSGMGGDIVVMDPQNYAQWMAATLTTPLQDNGKVLFVQFGCSTCHRTGAPGRGPSLEGIYNKPVQLEDGRTVTADDNYLRESILNPTAKIVSGFKPVMPTFQGIVSEEQLNALVAYIKGLNEPPPAGTAGLEPAVSPAQPQNTQVQ